MVNFLTNKRGVHDYWSASCSSRARISCTFGIFGLGVSCPISGHDCFMHVGLRWDEAETLTRRRPSQTFRSKLGSSLARLPLAVQM